MIDAHIHIEKGNYLIEWINEFINVALDRGLTEIYLLEHSHRFIEFRDMYNGIIQYNDYQKNWLDRRMKLSLEDYKNFILDLRRMKFPIKVKFGLEVCYVEGMEQITKDVLKDFEWDFITGSVHWIDNWGFDHKKRRLYRN